MQSLRTLPVIAALLIICVSSCSAIHCFHCHSHLEEKCGDPFGDSLNTTETPIVNCDNIGGDRNSTYCRKTVQTASLSGEETVRIIRSCGFEDEPKLALDEGEDPTQLRCYRRTGTHAVEIMYCACFADGCNSANTAGASGILLFLFALSALVYNH